jgi:hypothetical protein
LKEAKRALDVAEKETKQKAREDAQMARNTEKQHQQSILEAQLALKRDRTQLVYASSRRDTVKTDEVVIPTTSRSGRAIRPPAIFEGGKNPDY